MGEEWKMLDGLEQLKSDVRRLDVPAISKSGKQRGKEYLKDNQDKDNCCVAG
jgi:hypothetical protein